MQEIRWELFSFNSLTSFGGNIVNLTLTFRLIIAARRIDVGHLMLVDIKIAVMRLVTVIQMLHVHSWLQLHADHLKLLDN